MISILIYIVFLILNTIVFMFQRTTLIISRRYKLLRPNETITELQIYMTPNMVGLLAWLSTIGLYASLIYLWINLNLWVALGGLILSITVTTIVPIPYKLFTNIIKPHLKSELIERPLLAHKISQLIELVNSFNKTIK